MRCFHERQDRGKATTTLSGKTSGEHPCDTSAGFPRSLDGTGPCTPVLQPPTRCKTSADVSVLMPAALAPVPRALKLWDTAPSCRSRVWGSRGCSDPPSPPVCPETTQHPRAPRN